MLSKVPLPSNNPLGCDRSENLASIGSKFFPRSVSFPEVGSQSLTVAYLNREYRRYRPISIKSRILSRDSSNEKRVWRSISSRRSDAISLSSVKSVEAASSKRTLFEPSSPISRKRPSPPLGSNTTLARSQSAHGSSTSPKDSLNSLGSSRAAICVDARLRSDYSSTLTPSSPLPGNRSLTPLDRHSSSFISRSISRRRAASTHLQSKVSRFDFLSLSAADSDCRTRSRRCRLEGLEARAQRRIPRLPQAFAPALEQIEFGVGEAKARDPLLA